MEIEIEIEIGEYVRTRTDGICKLVHKEIDGNGKFCGYVDKPFFLRENNIISHSKNLIDLIQEGDFVNGELVVDKLQTPCRIGEDGRKFLFTKNMKVGEGYFAEDIKTILTKEQYMNNCYVKEEK